MILICKALSDTNRLEIVQMLSDGEKVGHEAEFYVVDIGDGAKIV